MYRNFLGGKSHLSRPRSFSLCAAYTQPRAGGYDGELKFKFPPRTLWSYIVNSSQKVCELPGMETRLNGGG